MFSYNFRIRKGNVYNWFKINRLYSVCDKVKVRYDYLDYAKAIAIIGVVFGHVFGFNNSVSIYFFSFHVPLFFIVSGILTFKNDMDIKKIIYEVYKSGGGYTDIIFKIIFGQRVGALWFLLTLFISMTFFKSLLNNVNDKKWLSIIGSSIYILPFLM